MECARAMGSAKTGSWAMESVAAKRASMGQPARCVSWAATDPAVPEVSVHRVGWWSLGRRTDWGHYTTKSRLK